jgi:hypothetical protein
LLLLIFCAFCDLDNKLLRLGTHVDLFESTSFESETRLTGELKLSQKIFLAYFFIAHVDTAGFAARLCLAFVLVKRQLKRTLRRRQVPLPESLLQDGSPILEPKRGLSPPPPYASSPPSPQLTGFSPLGEVTHAIIVPNYSESLETLASTLRVLASHPRARTQYEV